MKEQQSKYTITPGSFYILNENKETVAWISIYDENIMFEKDLYIEDLREVYKKIEEIFEEHGNK